MTETQIINSLNEKDEKVFKVFVDDNQQKVFRVCNNLINNSDDADDIAQDVFIEIYQSIHKFREDSSLNTWVYRIAVNKSLNFIKKRSRKGIVNSIESFFSSSKTESSMSKDDDNADYSLNNSEKGNMLQKAIDDLPANQKIAFTLNKVEELSYKQISEIMELSLSAIESLIHRARKNLQKSLTNYYKIDN